GPGWMAHHRPYARTRRRGAAAPRTVGGRWSSDLSAAPQCGPQDVVGLRHDGAHAPESSMSALAQALAYTRLIDGDATLALLRADNAPVIMALLATHLGGETRRRPADELYELIDAELDSLRDHFDLPGTGKSYGAAWRRAGWLIRRTATDARSETLELSPEALAAIRIADQIATPRQTATESRLMSIRDQLRRLAAESDPDVGRRLEQLERERAEIEARIARIRDGADVEVLEAGRARERFDEILRQAEDVPAE